MAAARRYGKVRNDRHVLAPKLERHGADAPGEKARHSSSIAVTTPFKRGLITFPQLSRWNVASLPRSRSQPAAAVAW
jgi:hypothetical protein